MRRIDADTDSRRLRLGVLAAALALLTVVAWVWSSSAAGEWSQVQDEFRDLAGVDEARELGVQEGADCAGGIERCRTCHLGAERDDLVGEDIPQPHRAHPLETAHHIALGIGCTTCHGGTGRALQKDIAHAWPGATRRDERMGQPYVQASCSKCHVPGAEAGMEALVAGNDLYAELGCAVCHPLQPSGLGGFDYGPDLVLLERRSVPYLRESIIDPTASFSKSTMPSFASSFAADDEDLAALVTYVRSLSLPPSSECLAPPKDAALVDRPCTTCHSGPRGIAGGNFQHRCEYLKARADELRCSACHDDVVGEGRCPLVEEHREGCFGCHR